MWSLLLVASLSAETSSADMVITQRGNRGRKGLLAGSGGALQQNDVILLNQDPTRTFLLSDSASVAVTENDPFSNAAAASGSISVSNNVTQRSGSSITLTATRSAIGDAAHFSRAGNLAVVTVRMAGLALSIRRRQAEELPIVVSAGASTSPSWDRAEGYPMKHQNGSQVC